MTVPDNTCLSFRNPILASPGLPVGLREMNNRPSVLQERLAHARVAMICIVWAISSVG